MFPMKYWYRKNIGILLILSESVRTVTELTSYKNNYSVIILSLSLQH